MLTLVIQWFKYNTCVVPMHFGLALCITQMAEVVEHMSEVSLVVLIQGSRSCSITEGRILTFRVRLSLENLV